MRHFFLFTIIIWVISYKNNFGVGILNDPFNLIRGTSMINTCNNSPYYLGSCISTKPLFPVITVNTNLIIGFHAKRYQGFCYLKNKITKF